MHENGASCLCGHLRSVRSLPSARARCRLTDLSRGDDILVFGVLVDSQAEDVISVLQVEALGSCHKAKQRDFWLKIKLSVKMKKWRVKSADQQTGSG